MSLAVRHHLLAGSQLVSQSRQYHGLSAESGSPYHGVAQTLFGIGVTYHCHG